MEKRNEPIPSDFSHIKGWGMDAHPDDEPNYPIKKYTGDDHQRIHWERPPLQDATVEILKSTERPSLSAVFGTRQPPSGLSGMMRRYAYRYSENTYTHWLTLLVADRVNVLEGMLEDAVHLKVPRLAAERGWGAIAEHQPKLLARKILLRTVLVSAAVIASTYLSRDEEKVSEKEPQLQD